MPQLISSQKAPSQIIFSEPEIVHYIIPSPSGLIYNPEFCLIIGHNPLNIILLVVTYNNKIWGPLLGPNR